MQRDQDEDFWVTKLDPKEIWERLVRLEEARKRDHYWSRVRDFAIAGLLAKFAYDWISALPPP